VIEVAALDRVSGGDPAAHVADVEEHLRPMPAAPESGQPADNLPANPAGDEENTS
jgi:hypothetical protein